MSATAQNVYDRALALNDAFGETDAGNEAKAPLLIDMLQRDLALCEDLTVTVSISALTDSLIISDDAALRVMPLGLAAKLALADKDAEFFNEYQSKYEEAKRTIGVTETAITDEMYVLSGFPYTTEEDEF